MASTAPAHDHVLDEILAVAPSDRVQRALATAQTASPLRLAALPPRPARRPTTRPSSPPGSRSACATTLRDVIYEHSRVTALHVGRRRRGRDRRRPRPRRRRGAGHERRHPRRQAAAQPPVGHLLAHRPDRAGATTSSTSSTGPAASASPTPARSCTTSAPPATAGSPSGGEAGGSRRAPASTARSRSTRRSPTQTHEHLVAMFPRLRGRRITHAWGGPIDVSPSHLPQIGTLERTRPLRLRLHRQRRRPVAPRRPRPRRAGDRATAHRLAVVDPSRSGPARAVRLRGRFARPPCLFT